MVANPMRGSFISRWSSPISSCWIWLSSRSVRWLIGPCGAGSSARGAGSSASGGLRHHLEALDDVALGNVVDRQPDAALEAGRHFADVVLEALQRLDVALGDLGATA